jgi:hypothetical protein
MSQIKKDSLFPKNGDNDIGRNVLLFSKGEHHAFIIKKTEKLASAIYLITNFIQTGDPLRTRLRDVSLHLVSLAAHPMKASSGYPCELFVAGCLELASLLKLGERSGLVSEMNARVLSDEYASLAAFVETHHERIFGGAPDIFVEPVRVTQKISIGNGQNREGVQKNGNGQIKKTNNYKRHQHRKETVLSLFDKKDRITIKDAAAAIEGCSEKTIQRELMALVDEGVLLKEGERRWSTYRKA